MARRFREADHDVRRMDLSEKARRRFEGATAPTISGLEDADVIITLPFEDDLVSAVNDDLVLAVAKSGLTPIDCSSTTNSLASVSAKPCTIGKRYGKSRGVRRASLRCGAYPG